MPSGVYERTPEIIAAIGGNHRTHGMSQTPTYQCWVDMVRRCTDETRFRADRYVLRGISVCDRWLVFENFFADMGVKPKGLTLDRENNNGNYEPGNCRWATPSQQSLNQEKRTHCRQGHPYLPGSYNYTTVKGGRRCKQCLRDRKR